MIGVNFTIELPESLFQEARAAGILGNEPIAALLAMELQCTAAWDRLNAAAAIVHEAAKSDFNLLSEGEVIQLVNEEIHLMRAEDEIREALHATHSA